MESYGQSTTFSTQNGNTAKRVDILVEAAEAMSDVDGCQLYVVSKDSNVQNHVQVFEVWNTKDDHENTLENLAATELIAQTRPLLDGTTQDHRTRREAAVYTRIIEDGRGSAEIKRCAKGHFVRKRLLDVDGEVYRTFRSIFGP